MPMAFVGTGNGAGNIVNGSPRVRSEWRRRSLVVLGSFTIAMLVAFAAPRLAFGLICAAMMLRDQTPSSVAVGTEVHASRAPLRMAQAHALRRVSHNV